MPSSLQNAYALQRLSDHIPLSNLTIILSALLSINLIYQRFLRDLSLIYYSVYIYHVINSWLTTITSSYSLIVSHHTMYQQTANTNVQIKNSSTQNLQWYRYLIVQHSFFLILVLSRWWFWTKHVSLYHKLRFDYTVYYII